jgi:hypothetical protein
MSGDRAGSGTLLAFKVSHGIIYGMDADATTVIAAYISIVSAILD